MGQKGDIQDIDQADPKVISSINTLLKSYLASVQITSSEITNPTGMMIPWVLMVNTCLAIGMAFLGKDKYHRMLEYMQDMIDLYKREEPNGLLELLNRMIKEDTKDAKVQSMRKEI